LLDRRQQEIELLRKKYGPLDHGPNLEWVLFKEFTLPPGWNRTTTSLLVLIPPGYPVTPPDNFYVSVGIRLGSGAMPSNYSEGPTHLGQQWGQFSIHAQKEHWKPSAELLEGDNLLTFMLVVERRLKEAN
jgi:hypothetical protein